MSVDWSGEDMKKKWSVEIMQAEWASSSWMTFYAESIKRKSESILIVDGHEMEFEEMVKDPVEDET